MKIGTNLKTIFCGAMFLLVGLSIAKADIADDNGLERISVHVQLMNGDKFPGYEFFVHYQGYLYYGGYEPDSVQEVPLTPGVSQATSEYGDKSYIYARDAAGKIYHSEMKYGGSIEELNPDYAYLLKKIEVIRITDDAIEVKVVGTMKMVDYEEVIEMKKGAVGGQVSEMLRFAILPLVCFLGLILFFVIRRRQTSRA